MELLEGRENGEPGGARLWGIKNRDEAESVEEFIDGAAKETPTDGDTAGRVGVEPA